MYVHKLILLITFLFISSCKEEVKVIDNFKVEITNRWQGVQRVSYKNKLLKPDESPTLTSREWTLLAEIELQTLNGDRTSDCLFVYNTDGYKLKIINKSKKRCIDHSKDKGIIEKSGIYNFTFWSTENELILKYDLTSIEIPFGGDKVYSKLSSIKNYSSITGLKDGVLCHNIDNECNESLKNNCHLCENGFFQTVNSSCTTKVSKVCGMDFCGERGKPACIRGFKVSKINPELYCIADSPVGFCKRGLRVICINNQLICE